jgi:hypothetical protein
MTDVIKIQEINSKIDDAINDIITVLEENRHEPAGRGAGTAPTGSACCEAKDFIIALVKELLDAGISKDDIGRVPTLEEIIFSIEQVQDHNIADDIDGLKEFEHLESELLDNKYAYHKTVYKHLASNRFILVTYRDGLGEWSGNICEVTAEEVTKKEIVRYEWS